MEKNGMAEITLLTEKQVAQCTGFSVKALQKWRRTGTGPKFIKVSPKAVRYRQSDIASWLESLERQSTYETKSRN